MAIRRLPIALAITAFAAHTAHAQWSATFLHPAAVTDSSAVGVAGAQQVGTAGTHASLWSGSAASWVDLHPSSPGLTDFSSAYATDGTHQVGDATIGGLTHAGLWNGTAASWTDLQWFLPAGFTRSGASGISTTGGVTTIVGFGYRAGPNR